MGSSGMKDKRGRGTKKGTARRHLPKVGTPAEARWEQHEARRDIVGNLGIHPGRGEGSRVLYWVVSALVVLALVGAIVALVSLD